MISKEEKTLLLAYKIGTIDSAYEMANKMWKKRFEDENIYYQLQEVRNNISRNINNIDVDKTLNKIYYIERSMKCYKANEEFEKNTNDYKFNNINDYILYFKKWKKYIKCLFELNEILPCDIGTSYDNNGFYFKMNIDNASYIYNKFMKKYKTHEKVLNENGLSDISNVIKKAYEIGKIHYSNYFKEGC